MPSNEIKDKFSISAALTITLASLASSIVGVGRQSTLIDNSSDRYQDLLIYVKLTQGTDPVGSKGAQVYLLKGDDDSTTEHLTDGAGASDAGITILNAPLIGAMINKASPATGEIMYGEFLVRRPGPTWGIVIVQDTGKDLNVTGSNHWVRWIGLNPEVQ